MNAPQMVPDRPQLADTLAARVRADFPILDRKVHDHRLVYLDNAATTQRPEAVIQAMAEHQRRYNANVHRGVHRLSMEATESYEGARATIANYLGAQTPEQIIFLRGTTEAINLLAHSFGQQLKAGDEIILSGMEHHSNIVPWQLLANRVGVVLKPIPLLDSGELDLEAYESLLSDKTKLVSVLHTSNALGTRNPVEAMIESAKAQGIPVHLDGAQATAHEPLNLTKLDCDFFSCSAHKMYGPMGFGVLYGKREALEALPPWQGGGDMILSVSFEGSTYNQVPYRFEAGTPNVIGAIGMAEACRYIEKIGFKTIQAAEQDLLQYADQKLATIQSLRRIGTAKHRAAVCSFVLEGVHPHDIGTILDRKGIAIRAGHHCSQPVMQHYGVAATARASFGIYNHSEDIDQLVSALAEVEEMFS